MAVHATPTEEKQNNHQAPTIDPVVSQQAPGVSSAPPTANLFSALNYFAAGRALGPEIEKYIESLRGYLKDTAQGVITIRRLRNPQGAHAIVSGNASIVILFDELLPPDVQNFRPQSDHSLIAAESFRQEVPNTDLLNVIIIQREDYGRVQQLYHHVSTNLHAATSAFRSANVSVLSGAEFFIDENTDAARRYVEANNPHNTQPRGDIGFVIHARTVRRDNRVLSSTPEESFPIAAVLAYTDIWLPSDPATGFGNVGQPQKYAATVHITNITSALPLAGIIPLALAVAADQFLDRRRWIQPYISFKKGYLNLGNLSTDPVAKSGPWFANNADELNAWYQANMHPRPFLAIDVPEGQARIPALAVWSDLSRYSLKTYEQIQTFFSGLTFDRSISPYTTPATTFVGSYGDTSGILKDSREIDYLNLILRGPQDQNSRALLYYNIDPAVRARIVNDKTSGTFKSIYRTPFSIINPNVLAAVSRAIIERVRIIGSSQQDRVIATPWLEELQKQYNHTGFNTQTTHQNTEFRFGTPTFTF